jgi:hypothetical protein
MSRSGYTLVYVSFCQRLECKQECNRALNLIESLPLLKEKGVVT